MTRPRMETIKTSKALSLTQTTQIRRLNMFQLADAMQTADQTARVCVCVGDKAVKGVTFADVEYLGLEFYHLSVVFLVQL